ncbi:MAG: hypothetical protein ACRDK3_17355 [Actinomycetota bacterium]
MDLVRPGLVGLGLCLAGVLVAVLMAPSLVARGGSDDGAAVLFTSLPVGLGAFAGGALAARLHREPQRRDRRRHLLAALWGIVLFAVVQSVAVVPGVEGEWLARILNLCLPPAAALLGMRLLDRSS